MKGIINYECRCGKKFEIMESRLSTGRDSLYKHYYEQWKKGDPDGCLKYIFHNRKRIKGFEKKLKKELEEKRKWEEDILLQEHK